MNFSPSNFSYVFDAQTLSRGAAYLSEGRVLSLSRQDDTLTGITLGSGGRRYVQQVSLTPGSDGRYAVRGLCTCPVGVNCKHVAALVLKALTTPGSAYGKTPPPAVSRPGALAPAPRAYLEPGLVHWLDRVAQAEGAEDDAPAASSQALIYVLAPINAYASTPELGLFLQSARRLKTGQYSSPKAYDLQSYGNNGPTKYMTREDRIILPRLRALPRALGRKTEILTEDEGGEVLDLILATGRARHGDVNGPVLSKGPARKATLRWATKGDDTLCLMAHLQSDALLDAEAEDAPGLGRDGAGPVQILSASPPVYIDVEAGLVGAIDLGIAPRLARRLTQAPLLPVSQLDSFSDRLEKSGARLSRLLPAPKVGEARLVKTAPRPVLQLTSVRISPSQSYYSSWNQPEPLLVAIGKLIFDYEGFRLAPGGPSFAQRFHEGVRVEIHRDPASEAKAIDALDMTMLLPASEIYPQFKATLADAYVTDDGDVDGLGWGWQDFQYYDIPDLQRDGWIIEIDRDFPFRLARPDGPIGGRVHSGEGSGIDWFELDLGVKIDGEWQDLIEPLAKMLESGENAIRALDLDEPVFLPLADGSLLPMPAGKILPLLDHLGALFAMRERLEGARFSRAEAPMLFDLTEALGRDNVVVDINTSLLTLGEKLRETGDIPTAAPPPSFQASLRPYQARGLDWLSFLAEAGLGGILADDMGLGKTVQTLALIAREKSLGRQGAPNLILAPTSLMENWRAEAAKFSPDLRLLIWQGQNRWEQLGEVEASDVVVTTYPLIARDKALFAEREWGMIILDEAQTIKNPNTATTKLIHELKASKRFCLTGTPMENHLGELWSLFEFINPGYLGPKTAFAKHWRQPIEKKGDEAKARRLAARIRPFMLRRTKAQVAPELPPRIDIVERISFGPEQQAAYEAVRLSMHKRVRDAIAARGLHASQIIILDALLKLRQICCDPRLVRKDEDTPPAAASAKLERLMEMVSELISEGRRVLIFSQFTSMLDLIKAAFDQEGWSYALLTGDTKDRKAQITAFQSGEVPLFLISLKAGGVGLNLTTADTVILYDPWWNPAVEDQAIDRAHRIGQDKTVFVHKLVVIGSIEEKMDVLKAKKRALADGLVNQEGKLSDMITEEDVRLLFE
ncbi:MAG: DEAD/DEAH box helicase [Asticcacaulis sp.]|uniref:DEAD/DEAH box helicase n=1 Tax=Asticcacaulis sp. TaxID=1872648 RepID=UPI003F7BD14F